MKNRSLARKLALHLSRLPAAVQIDAVTRINAALQTGISLSLSSLESLGLLDVKEGLHDPLLGLSLDEWSAEAIKVVSIFEPEYPELLKSIYNPPPILFYRGELRDGHGRLKLDALHPVAIVGARKASSTSSELARALAQKLSGMGAVVISGLAYGVDSSAHRGSLEKRSLCPTIAVLGCGLRTVYPASHCTLAKDIVDAGGLLISQFEPGERPYPSNFLARNRIIAGLSRAVILIQAAARSGSLVTARFALEEGRDVMAVPGSIFDPNFEGSNILIKQGAYLVTSLEDILAALPELEDVGAGSCGTSECAASVSSPSRQAVLETLRSDEQVHFDELRRRIPGTTELPLVVLELEMEGLIKRAPGNYLRLVRAL